MLLTAELRLWWSSRPAEVEPLFDQALAAEALTDTYLFDPETTDVGIKSRSGEGRSGAVEVKSLVACRDPCRLGIPQLWVKVAARHLDLANAPTVRLRKVRRRRFFRVQEGRACEERGGERHREGCHVELAEVRVEETPILWWTLGFEAFGSLEDVERSLGLTMDEIAPSISDRSLEGAICCSYPGWIAHVVPRMAKDSVGAIGGS